MTDDSLRAIARDLENDPRGLGSYAARLWVLLERSPFILPQIAVSPPVVEPTFPDLLEYDFDAPAEGET